MSPLVSSGLNQSDIDRKIICQVLVRNGFGIHPIITEEEYNLLSDEEKGPLLMTVAICNEHFNKKKTL